MTLDRRYGPLLQETFLTGVYLAVNAIPDAYLVIDGPSCAAKKGDQLVRNHDLNSTLLRHVLPHRIAQTDLEDNLIVFGDEERALRILQNIASQADAGVVLFTGMTCAVIMGRDQGRVVRSLAGQTEAPVLSVASRVSSSDWLGGYAETLNTLALGLPLAPREEPGERPRVGIVGYMHTRHEGDCAGDVAELRRMVEALGAELTSIWLDGGKTTSLSRIGAADLLVSLPVGRKAARLLAKRSGARVIDLPLPFSWQKSREFLENLAEAIDGKEHVPQALHAFLDPLADGTLFLAERYLCGTRWLFLGDPTFQAGLMEFAKDCGAEVVTSLATSRTDEPVPFPVLHGDDPSWRAHAQSLLDENRVDLVIGNGVAASRLAFGNIPFVEFGYPCYTRHPFTPTPGLGFLGGAWFVEALAQALCRKQTLGSLASQRET